MTRIALIHALAHSVAPINDALARDWPEAVRMNLPNEAMVADAAAMGVRVGLVATFAPTLQSMPPEFPAGLQVACKLADGALAALNAGDATAHDALIAQAAVDLAQRGCGVIALAQFSMARARSEVASRTGLPVLTTVDSAVSELKRRLGA